MYLQIIVSLFFIVVICSVDRQAFLPVIFVTTYLCGIN